MNRGWALLAWVLVEMLELRRDRNGLQERVYPGKWPPGRRTASDDLVETFRSPKRVNPGKVVFIKSFFTMRTAKFVSSAV
jgi:hypothetical protein